jgi:HD-like signal output (HDOD) protein
MVLTGQTEQESVMKSVFIAHISLAKPCDHELLKSVVSRACNLNAILQSEELRAAVGQVEMLPAVPQTYIALNEAMSRPNCGVKDLARIIEQDVGLCAKILQLVNSAFFGLSRKTGCLCEAITYLGTETIKAIALALEAFSGGPGASALSLDELAELQRHSVLTGQIARRLVSQERNNAEETFLAGMLHDVGWLIQVPPGTASDRAFDRALLGAYLLGLWGLPHSIIEAVAYHRAPRLLPHSKWEMVDVIHVAHHLAAESRGGQDGQGLDLEHLETLGVSRERLEQWRSEIEGASRQAPS